MQRVLVFFLLWAFALNSLGPVPVARADDFVLPVPGAMVPLSPAFNPPVLKGIKVHPEDPFRFDFILDEGDSQWKGTGPMRSWGPSPSSLREESTKLIKYFLASLTIPEKDLWVNLSPYEKNRIIPQSFGLTEMGRDLLAEDYMLKQITASLIYPEGETGRRFWQHIYQEAYKRFGTTNVPVNTFNKVWIVPEKAVVYENVKAGTAYVVEAKLKVMLEQDYLSFGNSDMSKIGPSTKTFEGDKVSSLGSEIIREIVIPELTREVNYDRNFAQLRQVYNSLILATWYKKKIKDSILAQVYADKDKVKGLSFPNASVGNPQYIYQQYLKAFKKGVFNYIKEEPDPMTQQDLPRKYFSGGFTGMFIDRAMSITSVQPLQHPGLMEISAGLAGIPLKSHEEFEFQGGLLAPAGITEKVRIVQIADVIHQLDSLAQQEFQPALLGEYPHYTIRLAHLANEVPERAAELKDRKITILYKEENKTFKPSEIFWLVPQTGRYLRIPLDDENQKKSRLFTRLFSLLKGDEFDYDLTYKPTERLESDFWDKWGSNEMRTVRGIYRDEIYPAASFAVLSLINGRFRKDPGKVINLVDIYGGDGEFLGSLYRLIRKFFSHAATVPKIEYWLIERNQNNILRAQESLKGMPVHIIERDLEQEPLHWSPPVDGGADIITSIGGGFNNGPTGTQYQALRLADDVRKVLNPGGDLVIAGLTHVLLSTRQFESQGFDPLNFSVPLNLAMGKQGVQLYVLRKKADGAQLSRPDRAMQGLGQADQTRRGILKFAGLAAASAVAMRLAPDPRYISAYDEQTGEYAITTTKVLLNHFLNRGDAKQRLGALRLQSILKPGELVRGLQNRFESNNYEKSALLLGQMGDGLFNLYVETTDLKQNPANAEEFETEFSSDENINLYTNAKFFVENQDIPDFQAKIRIFNKLFIGNKGEKIVRSSPYILSDVFLHKVTSRDIGFFEEALREFPDLFDPKALDQPVNRAKALQWMEHMRSLPSFSPIDLTPDGQVADTPHNWQMNQLLRRYFLGTLQFYLYATSIDEARRIETLLNSLFASIIIDQEGQASANGQVGYKTVLEENIPITVAHEQAHNLFSFGSVGNDVLSEFSSDIREKFFQQALGEDLHDSQITRKDDNQVDSLDEHFFARVPEDAIENAFKNRGLKINWEIMADALTSMERDYENHRLAGPLMHFIEIPYKAAGATFDFAGFIEELLKRYFQRTGQPMPEVLTSTMKMTIKGRVTVIEVFSGFEADGAMGAVNQKDITDKFGSKQGDFKVGYVWVDGTQIPPRISSNFGGGLIKVLELGEEVFKGEVWRKYLILKKSKAGQRTKSAVYGRWDGKIWTAVEGSDWGLYKFATGKKMEFPRRGLRVKERFTPQDSSFKSGFYWVDGTVIPTRTASHFRYFLEDVYWQEKIMAGGEIWYRFEVTNKGEKGRYVYGNWDGKNWSTFEEDDWKLFLFMAGETNELPEAGFSVTSFFDHSYGTFSAGFPWIDGTKIRRGVSSGFGIKLKEVFVTGKVIVDGKTWVKFKVVHDNGREEYFYGLWDGKNWAAVEEVSWELYKFMTNKEARLSAKGINVSRYFSRFDSEFQNGFYWIDGTKIPSRVYGRFGEGLENVFIVDRKEAVGRTWILFKVQKTGGKVLHYYGTWDGKQWIAWEYVRPKLSVSARGKDLNQFKSIIQKILAGWKGDITDYQVRHILRILYGFNRIDAEEVQEIINDLIRKDKVSAVYKREAPLRIMLAGDNSSLLGTLGEDLVGMGYDVRVTSIKRIQQLRTGVPDINLVIVNGHVPIEIFGGGRFLNLSENSVSTNWLQNLYAIEDFAHHNHVRAAGATVFNATVEGDQAMAADGAMTVYRASGRFFKSEGAYRLWQDLKKIKEEPYGELFEKLRGKTQQQIAAMYGISPGKVSALLNGLNIESLGTAAPQRLRSEEEQVGRAKEGSHLSESKGGIDLTANKVPLQIKTGSPIKAFGNDSVREGGDGMGIKFHLDPAQVAQLQNAPGFVPVIINIQPMTDLHQFLGLKATPSKVA